jgi:hypothetical protein
MHAFIDESGNANLETQKAGVSNYFVLGCVLVAPDNLVSLRAAAELIRERYAGTGELRSTNLVKNHPRLLQLIGELRDLPFAVALLAVDKDALFANGGLSHKKSFLKYLHGILYSRLFQTYEELHVVADEVGRQAFMDSFIDYVKHHHLRTLFGGQSFTFVNSKADVLVQLADLAAGSFGRIYEGKWSEKERQALFAAWKPHLRSLHEWPPRYANRMAALPASKGSDLDRKLARASFDRAAAFLEQHRASHDRARQAQVIVLEKLLFQVQYEDPKTYASTEALLRHLSERGIQDIRLNGLRSDVIAKLRDSGVLIASSSQGYKIPCTLRDLHDFVDRMSTIIEPLLGRISAAREVVSLLSDGSEELLKDHDLLRRAVEQIAEGCLDAVADSSKVV